MVAASTAVVGQRYRWGSRSTGVEGERQGIGGVRDIPGHINLTYLNAVVPLDCCEARCPRPTTISGVFNHRSNLNAARRQPPVAGDMVAVVDTIGGVIGQRNRRCRRRELVAHVGVRDSECSAVASRVMGKDAGFDA